MKRLILSLALVGSAGAQMPVPGPMLPPPRGVVVMPPPPVVVAPAPVVVGPVFFIGRQQQPQPVSPPVQQTPATPEQIPEPTPVQQESSK